MDGLDTETMLRLAHCPAEELFAYWGTGAGSTGGGGSANTSDSLLSRDAWSPELAAHYTRLLADGVSPQDYYYDYTDSTASNASYLLPYGDEYPVTGQSSAVNMARQVEDFINSVLVVGLCALGLLGNLLNIAILGYRCARGDPGRMEKFALSGLTALAATDLLFCLLVLPHATVDPHRLVYPQRHSFGLLYSTYCGVPINACVLCSILLVVALALGRYVVILHPLRAREVLGMTFARRMIAAIVLVSALANLPRVWMTGIREIRCVDGSSWWYVERRDTYRQLEVVYLSSYFAIGMCVPTAVLIYCHVFLVLALRRSAGPALRGGDSGGGDRPSFARHQRRLTLCLVVIIGALLVLVMPGEALVFFRRLSARHGADRFNLPLAVCSLLQALNFSFNFCLYCAVNTSFRRSLLVVFHCSGGGGEEGRGGSATLGQGRKSLAERLTGYRVVGSAQAQPARTDIEFTSLNTP